MITYTAVSLRSWPRGETIHASHKVLTASDPVTTMPTDSSRSGFIRQMTHG